MTKACLDVATNERRHCLPTTINLTRRALGARETRGGARPVSNLLSGANPIDAVADTLSCTSPRAAEER
jgi:hypothetical protein